MTDYLIKRNGIYYYMRRVPDAYAAYDSRRFVRTSLKTRDRREAIRKSLVFNDFIESYWISLSSNGQPNSLNRYELAVKQAKAHGFEYQSVAEVASQPIEKIVERVLATTKALECDKTVSALLGGEEHPPLTLERLWAEYEAFSASDLTVKSERQRKRWINPRIRAWGTFVKVCGDIPVSGINRQHILGFRSWWANRIQKEGMSPNSANKDLSHLRSLLAFAQDNKSNIPFDVTSLFARIRFKERESERRPFKTDYIKNTLLNVGNLHGLNEECKLFLFAMSDTGARPSELLGLNPENRDIRLDTDIPYIFIRPDEHHEIKNSYSKRQLPLVGASLHAFQQLNGGFQHYYNRADELSANLNKYLRVRGLLPSTDHSVYSLRHSFEDRLSAVEPPEKIQSFIMGHQYRRERYGDGPSLAQKKKWLDKMCFKID